MPNSSMIVPTMSLDGGTSQKITKKESPRQKTSTLAAKHQNDCDTGAFARTSTQPCNDPKRLRLTRARALVKCVNDGCVKALASQRARGAALAPPPPTPGRARASAGRRLRGWPRGGAGLSRGRAAPLRGSAPRQPLRCERQGSHSASLARSASLRGGAPARSGEPLSALRGGGGGGGGCLLAAQSKSSNTAIASLAAFLFRASLLLKHWRLLGQRERAAPESFQRVTSSAPGGDVLTAGETNLKFDERGWRRYHYWHLSSQGC